MTLVLVLRVFDDRLRRQTANFVLPTSAKSKMCQAYDMQIIL